MYHEINDVTRLQPKKLREWQQYKTYKIAIKNCSMNVLLFVTVRIE